MVFRDRDKDLLLENAPVVSRITVLSNGTVLSEENEIVSWTLEDYRYVPDNGVIGQFVAKLLDGSLQNIPNDLILENETIKLEIGVVDRIINEEGEEETSIQYYNYGNFLITKVTTEDTSGDVSFEATDYTKYFNKIYESSLSYPCLALELANNVCGQAGVSMYGKGVAWCYAIPKDTTLSEGKYCFKYNNTSYYEFTTTSDMKLYDSLLYVEGNNYLVQKTIDDQFNITRTNIPVSLVSSSTGTMLNFNDTSYNDFINNDFVIIDNQFEEDNTCRDVMKCISQLAYSWVRIGEDNNVHIDFSVKSESDIDDYSRLSGDQYYESSVQDIYYGPVNKVAIGLSTVDGENIIVTSEDYTPETECCVQIFDNNLTYTEELRRIAIHGAESLFGFNYIALEVDTIGLIWLEGDDFIELTNTDNIKEYTYPFNRTISYQGYIDSHFSSHTTSSIEQEYEYESATLNTINKTKITVDKQNQEISLAVTTSNEASKTASEAKIESGKISTRVEEVEKDINGEDGLTSRMSVVEQDVKSITNTFQITGGNNLIKNSAFLFTDNVWDFTNTASGTHYHTNLGEGYLGVLSGSVKSVSRIDLCNINLKSAEENITNLVVNAKYSLNFYYSLDPNTTATVKLYPKGKPTEYVFNETYNTEASMEHVKITEMFTATQNSYVLDITTESVLNGHLTLYDIMLNKGDALDWEPASGEISSTYIKLSQIGLQVLSTGSKIATLMTSDGFSIYEAFGSGSDISIGEEPITDFDVDGIKTKDISCNSLSIKTYIICEKELDTNGVTKKHHLEYFKED